MPLRQNIKFLKEFQRNFCLEFKEGGTGTIAGTFHKNYNKKKTLFIEFPITR